MRRVLTTLAAMAAAAAVAAALTIPAGAQDGGGQDTALAHFTACLSAHGVAVPAGLDGLALKQWLAQRQDQAPIAGALAACSSESSGGKPGAPDNGFDHLYSCLTSHGVDVEKAPDLVKRKAIELNGTEAGRAILAACKISFREDSGKAGDAQAPKPEDDARPEVCGAKS